MAVSENPTPAENRDLHPFEQIDGFKLLSDELRQKLKAMPPEKINPKILAVIQKKIEGKKLETKVVQEEENQKIIKGEEKEAKGEEKEANGEEIIQLAGKTERGENLSDEEAGFLMGVARESGEPITNFAKIRDLDNEYSPHNPATNLKIVSAQSDKEFLTSKNEMKVSADMNVWNEAFREVGEKTAMVFPNNQQTWIDFANFVRGKSDNPNALKNAVEVFHRLNSNSMRAAIEKSGLMSDDGSGFTLDEKKLKNWFAKNQAAIETGEALAQREDSKKNTPEAVN